VPLARPQGCDDSQPKSTVGTPAYIAPEVLGRAIYDGSVRFSDAHSNGGGSSSSGGGARHVQPSGDCSGAPVLRCSRGALSFRTRAHALNSSPSARLLRAGRGRLVLRRLPVRDAGGAVPL